MRQPKRPWQFMIRTPSGDTFVYSTFATHKAAETKRHRLRLIWAAGYETYVRRRPR